MNLAVFGTFKNLSDRFYLLISLMAKIIFSTDSEAKDIPSIALLRFLISIFIKTLEEWGNSKKLYSETRVIFRMVDII